LKRNHLATPDRNRPEQLGVWQHVPQSVPALEFVSDVVGRPKPIERAAVKPGVDVVITIFYVLRQFSAEK
jgi:hypothetical protein